MGNLFKGRTTNPAATGKPGAPPQDVAPDADGIVSSDSPKRAAARKKAVRSSLRIPLGRGLGISVGLRATTAALSIQ